MSFFTHAKASRAAAKVAEELIYEQVAAEVAAGAIRQGLWAKAIAESDGNEAAAKARYIKLRVELLIAEADLAEHAAGVAVHEAERAAKESARESQQAWEAAEAKRFETKAFETQGTGAGAAYSILTVIVVLIIVTGAAMLLSANQ